MSTNHSKQTIGRIVAMACDVAQVEYGRDLAAVQGASHLPVWIGIVLVGELG